MGVLNLKALLEKYCFKSYLKILTTTSIKYWYWMNLMVKVWKMLCSIEPYSKNIHHQIQNCICLFVPYDLYIEPRSEKTGLWDQVRHKLSWAVQPLKIDDKLEFSNSGSRGIVAKNKGADQLRGYSKADLCLCFHICKNNGFLTARLTPTLDGLFSTIKMIEIRK